MPTKKKTAAKTGKKIGKKPAAKAAKSAKPKAKPAVQQPAKNLTEQEIVLRPIKVAGPVFIRVADEDIEVQPEVATPTVKAVLDPETGVITMVPQE